MYVYSKSPFSRGHHVFAVGIQSAKISRGIRHQWMSVLLTVCVAHKWYLFFNFWLKCWNKTINVIRGSKQLRYQTYFWTETRCTGLAQLSSRVGPVLQSFWEWANTNELLTTSCVKSNLTFCKRFLAYGQINYLNCAEIKQYESGMRKYAYISPTYNIEFKKKKQIFRYTHYYDRE